MCAKFLSSSISITENIKGGQIDPPPPPRQIKAKKKPVQIGLNDSYTVPYILP